MDCAGTGSGKADADFSGEFCVRRCHEGGHFLVAHLDEFGIVLRPVQGADETVDAISGVAEYAVHTPLAETLPQEIANSIRHVRLTAWTVPLQRSAGGRGASHTRICTSVGQRHRGDDYWAARVKPSASVELQASCICNRSPAKILTGRR